MTGKAKAKGKKRKEKKRNLSYENPTDRHKGKGEKKKNQCTEHKIYRAPATKPLSFFLSFKNPRIKSTLINVWEKSNSRRQRKYETFRA